MWAIRHNGIKNNNIMNFLYVSSIYTFILVPSTCGRIISDINTRCIQGFWNLRSNLSPPNPTPLSHTHTLLQRSQLLAAYLFASTAVNSTLQIQTSVFFYAPRHLTFIQIDLMYFLDYYMYFRRIALSYSKKSGKNV